MGRFEQFQAIYKPANDAVQTVTTPRLEVELIRQIPGFSELIGQYAGKPLSGGIYRLLDDPLVEAAETFVSYAFPVWVGNVAPFGCDWMGRIYAVDGSKRRAPNGEHCAMLLDPATRDLLRVPASVTDFHNEMLISDAETALEQDLWTDWRRATGRPLMNSEVVGWKKPGFLGGELTLANLEIQPAVVYWDLSGQLIAQAFKLKTGTPVRSVKIE